MLRRFLYIYKSDRQVLLAILIIAAIALAVISLGGRKESEAPVASLPTADTTAVDTLSAAPAAAYYRQEECVAERFAFDPNTADSTQLLRLGLQPWQVRNIYKYRAAGGIYRKKEDFARLYGLTVKQYRELEPYIHISADYQPAATLFGEEPREERVRDTLRYPEKLSEGQTVDLAQADTTLLRRVPGIGSYYARRIAEYRQRLGGFVSLDQLDEIDGFPQESKQYLTLATPTIRRLNINSASLNELKSHPYINFYMARAITDYRRQYGTIRDLQDLRLLPDFTPEVIERLTPYVEY